ncbi:Orotidine 5'-phosphate decarboxylase [[Clostridium] ultunense Esp]|nr:Orotidine 5'-phosphate decarboxylase [[Clostridium] ultunense Esp]
MPDKKEKIRWRERLIIALDFPATEEARSFIERMEGEAVFYKVGMELFYQAGPSFIAELKEKGLKVFLDLKLHDIPNTVKGAARSLARLGVDLITVHALGGGEMMEAAKEGVESVHHPRGAVPLLFAVTLLTSHDEKSLRQELKIFSSISEMALHLSSLAKTSGMDGIVSSAWEVEKVKKNLGKDFLTLTPGIRKVGDPSHDQKRPASPEEAGRLGADYLVLGRTVTKAADPAASFREILESLETIKRQ